MAHETPMYDAGADLAEVHLPERWVVLEQALRQIYAEDAAAKQSGHLIESEQSL